MKLLHLYLAVLLCITSCEKNSSLSNTIELEQDKVVMKLGQTVKVKILSNEGIFAVVPEKESAITAETVDNTIEIQANGEVGSFNFAIIDKSKKYQQTSVQVVVQGITGGWKLDDMNINIEASNEAKELIERDIKESSIKDLFNIGFSHDNCSLNVIDRDTKQHKGSYIFEFPSLELLHNNTSMLFNVEFIGPIAMMLSQDLTKKYTSIYPDKEITKVELSIGYLYVTL